MRAGLPGLVGVNCRAYLGHVGPAVVGGVTIAVPSSIRAGSLVGWAGIIGSQLLLQVATLSVGLWSHGRRVPIRTLRDRVETLRCERELRAEQAPVPATPVPDRPVVDAPTTDGSDPDRVPGPALPPTPLPKDVP